MKKPTKQWRRCKPVLNKLSRHSRLCAIDHIPPVSGSTLITAAQFGTSRLGQQSFKSGFSFNSQIRVVISLEVSPKKTSQESIGEFNSAFNTPMKRLLQPNIAQKKRRSSPPSTKNTYKVLMENLLNIKPTAEDEVEACSCQDEQGEVACGLDCINRNMLVECDPRKCPNKMRCANQQIQRGEWKSGLLRFTTKGRGWGIKTSTPILAGEYILEYIGQVIDVYEFQRRMAEEYKNEPNHYCLYIDSKTVIDGYRQAHEGRFVNHSCEPNCEMQKWNVNGMYRIGLFALRNIAADEELSYDYNFQPYNLETQQKCKCGSPKCRGVIGKRNTAQLTRALSERA